MLTASLSTILASALLALSINATAAGTLTLLGVGAVAGTLEAGKSADLIAVAADPLADLTALKKVDFVMMSGQVVKSRQ